jgi:hypothetical protein
MEKPMRYFFDARDITTASIAPGREQPVEIKKFLFEKSVVAAVNEVYTHLFPLLGDSCIFEPRCKVRLDEVLPFTKSWIHAFEKQLDEMRSLAHDWNSYGSAPPNALAIWNTTNILENLNRIDFAPTNIAPSAEEGVVVSFVKGDRYAVIECYNDGEILAAFSEGARDPEVLVVGDSKQDLMETIDRANAFIEG